MMDNEWFSCCFTGHRMILPEHKYKLRNELINVIEMLYEKGCRVFLSGGALGFDLMAAEAVIEFRKKHNAVRLAMVLPCRDYHRKWSRTDIFRCEKILESADKTVFLCETYCTGCMHLRNKYLVDNSQICVAYYNHTGGGTAHTVNYARDKELEIINLAYRI